MTDQQNAEALESVKDEGTQPEQSADAGTAQEGGSEEKPQPDYDKIIAEKAFEARKAKREKKELEEKLKSLEAQNAPKEPEIPSMPDRYDFETDAEFQEAIAKRDQALIEKSRLSLDKEQAEKRKLEAEQDAQKVKMEELNQKVEVYSSRAKEFKIEPAEMQKIGEILEVYELRPDIVEAVLDDEEGPLIAKYLASNPNQVQALNSSTWMNGESIYKQVKESASALKPKVTSAPEPAEILTGGASVGSGDTKYKMW